MCYAELARGELQLDWQDFDARSAHCAGGGRAVCLAEAVGRRFDSAHFLERGGRHPAWRTLSRAGDRLRVFSIYSKLSVNRIALALYCAKVAIVV